MVYNARSIPFLVKTVYGTPLPAFVKAFDSLLPALSKYIAATFFLAISAPIVWILLFDTFRVISSARQDSTTILGIKLVPSLVGTYFGYLWAFIHIVIAIAVTGPMGSLLPESILHISFPLYATHSNIDNDGKFLSYGFWVFVAALFVQRSLIRSDLRHIFPIFGLYVFFAILVTVGFTIITAMPTHGTETCRLLIANFVLSQVCGALALYMATLAGHT